MLSRCEGLKKILLMVKLHNCIVKKLDKLDFKLQKKFLKNTCKLDFFRVSRMLRGQKSLSDLYHKIILNHSQEVRTYELSVLADQFVLIQDSILF